MELLQVAVSMQDGTKLSQLSLFSAKLEVLTTLVLHNGSEIILDGEEKICEPLLPVWKHSSSISSEVRRRPNLRVSDIRGIVLDARYKDDTFEGKASMYLQVGRRKHRLYISCSTRQPQVRLIINK